MHNPPRRSVTQLAPIPIAVAAGCAVAFAFPASAPAAAEDVASLRAQGPAALRGLLASYDLTPPGAERDRLAHAIDAVAAQRYATVSRLYWYTDLDAAQAAARAEHRPILALRMLGRLDEDLSCANSRLFRTTLYADAEVSKLLRDQFILYWSSERPVPRVTIDFGDGRKLERTTTGNSAHYVLDEHGRLVDVLPGLYAPAVFRAELARSLELAGKLRSLSGTARATALRAHHDAAQRRAADRYGGAAGLRFVAGHRRLLTADEVGPTALQRAQRATMSKMRVEVPELRQIGIDAGSVSTDDVETWAAVGQQVWRVAASPFDERSLEMIRRLHDAGPLKSTAPERAAMIARLEQHVIADTALNEFALRPQIRARIIANPSEGWTALNEWVYATVFHTPRTDPWLGLVSRTDFTGLPGDGVLTEAGVVNGVVNR